MIPILLIFTIFPPFLVVTKFDISFLFSLIFLAHACSSYVECWSTSNFRSNMQSGCCKPSNDCDFNYVSPIVWNRTATTSPNPDCNLWENDPNVLCFNCQACKAGLLDNIKSNWKKVAVVNIVFLVFLIIVYSVGCCAFRNNREDNAYQRQWKWSQAEPIVL